MLNNSDMFNETRSYLNKVGFPAGDYETFEVSDHQFEAGGHYGIELSSMNSIDVLTRAIELTKQYRIKISRVIECRGIVRLPDDEIKAMVRLCLDERIGLILSVGPRAISDIGGFVSAPNGARLGYRLRGMENIIHAVEDIKRAVCLGVRGFLLYDEGLLFLLNRMRSEGFLPQDIILKYSVHAGCANPLSAKLLEQNGADCINIIPDLDVWMIKTFRQVIKVPLDVFSDTAKAAGGFLRTYDVPKIIRYAAPVYFKCGPISQPQQNHLPSSTELQERVKQTRNVVEHIERYIPEAIMVNEKEKTIAMPYENISGKLKQINNVAGCVNKLLSSKQEAVN